MTRSIETAELILASGSDTRRQMLEAAGIAFRVVVATVDEDAIRRDLYAADPDTSGTHVAELLSRTKAEEVSQRFPSALVIGADQVLEIGREIYTKPRTIEDARLGLKSMSGRMHRLVCAVSLAKSGSQVWQHIDAASLTMRDFSDEFLDGYLARAGERVCASVGAYELEGLGIQLFERIDGDYFTILGLPLLPLLAELRGRGAIPS